MKKRKTTIWKLVNVLRKTRITVAPNMKKNAVKISAQNHLYAKVNLRDHK